MELQPWNVRNAGTGATATTLFAEPFGFTAWVTSGNLRPVPMVIAATIRNLKIVRGTAPGSGVTATYTFRNNGSNTSLACSISGTDTEGQDTSNTAVFAIGDDISIQCAVTGGTPAASTVHLSFDIETVGDAVSVYGGESDTIAVADAFRNLFAMGRNSDAAVSSMSDESNLWPVAGTMTGFRIAVNNAPGTGDSWIYTIYKNETAQDGSGGTPDTRVTIAGAAATEGSSSFSLSLAVGDRVALRMTPTGTPAGGIAGWTFAFTADTDGQFVVSSVSDTDTASAVASDYSGREGNATNKQWSGTESDQRNICGITGFQITGLVVRSSAANDGRVVSVRKNGADEGPTLTFSGGGVAFTGGGTVSVSNGDFWNVRTAGSSTPIVHYALGGLIAGADTPGPLTSNPLLRQALIGGGMAQ